MAIFAELLEPKVFAELSNEDMERLSSVVDAEIIKDPEMRKKIAAAVERVVPAFLEEKRRRNRE